MTKNIKYIYIFVSCGWKLKSNNKGDVYIVTATPISGCGLPFFSAFVGIHVNLDGTDFILKPRKRTE
jgi:hypothetical protein